MAEKKDQAAVGVEPGAPTCPPRRWCEWRREHPGNEAQGAHGGPAHVHHWHHWQHWQRLPGDQTEGPPRDWQQWHERRWHGHCPWRSGRPSAAAGPRVPLDDSRWMEDYFSWF
ncbi:hypothetical protein R5R35_010297 [Gryllus longicercus]|uniref:Uncharacterized protein n=1 Tax=Gryllus longicercus TaxID=2509291 RepID=A0AAN9Z117_9ORTH